MTMRQKSLAAMLVIFTVPATPLVYAGEKPVDRTQSISKQVAGDAPDDYKRWRVEREKKLRNPRGYLSLTGLFWLDEGKNTIGTAEDNSMVLPHGRGPAHLGSITMDDDKIVFHASGDVPVAVDGKTTQQATLLSDAGGRQATRVTAGDLMFWVVDRFGRLGIRLSDPSSPELKSYTGTASFAYDSSFRLPARYVAAADREAVDVPNFLGSTTSERVIGKVVFQWEGKTYELTGADTSGPDLFIVFGDKTNGKETYGAGRFITVQIPKEGHETVIDFNRAHNPACAYNKYTTCPFPTAENRLPFAVPVGETMQGLTVFHGAH